MQIKKQELRELRTYLAARNFQAVSELSATQRRTLSFLTALSYDPEELVAWRAVEAFGLAADVLAEGEPEFVRGHLRRLMWLLNDESGGIGWRAAESIGEVLHYRPEMFADFIPILLSFLDMEAEEDSARFRAGVLWGIARLAQVRPQACRPVRMTIRSFLSDSDAQVRGVAAWCLGFIGSRAEEADLDALLNDTGLVLLYREGELEPVQVGHLACESRERIAGRNKQEGQS